MKTKILLATGVAALLLMSGCSKQPELDSVKETNATQVVQQKAEETKNAVQNNVNETVNTDNANVEVKTLESDNAAKQQFAKELANTVIYFDFDKYNIRADQWPKVEKIAKLIKENNSNYTVRIEGNCDEWGTEEYNYALGLKRANAVKNALVKLGVDPKKLTIISYGELNPVCTAHARWCWRKNRRDNFTYLP